MVVLLMLGLLTAVVTASWAARRRKAVLAWNRELEAAFRCADRAALPRGL